jgi:uncharacterized membrane protein YeaQ/YmgE (transglycosylase-associated protein family)
MNWIWLIIVGAIVGALGRLINPGIDPMGIFATIIIGVVSLLVAGAIVGTGAWGFIVGVIVAVILVSLVGRYLGEGRRSTASI